MSIRTWLASVLLLAAIGCGDDETKAPTTPRPGGRNDAGSDDCVDEDDDGFGRNCSRGNDCNDDDPDITDECRRCLVPTKNCRCTPGTPQVSCEPPVKHVDGGTLVCAEGTRYCRDGFWGDCETIGQYVFVAN
ncbi:MAG: hypothetical protein ABW321_01420 [Polyangiales bacterium]